MAYLVEARGLGAPEPAVLNENEESGYGGSGEVNRFREEPDSVEQPPTEDSGFGQP